jgi:hypothetical protein
VQHFVHVRPKVRPQPVLDRQAIALLAAVQHEIRQNALHRLSIDGLRPEAGEPASARNTGCELDERVVEEGHADLERVRHRHLIHLHQDRVGHREPQIDITLLREPVGAGHAGAVAPHGLERVLVNARKKLGPEEHAILGG